MVGLFIVFWGISTLSSIVAAPTYSPPSSVGGFPLLRPSPAFVICRLFNDGRSDPYRYLVVFTGISLITSDAEHLSCAYLQSIGHAVFADDRAEVIRVGLSPVVCACMPAQSCLTLCDPMDCSLPGSSVRGIFQARILEWVAISLSRGSSRPRDRTWISCVSCIAGRFFID